MNFADIQQTWGSPSNRPSPAQIETEKMKFIADLNRRRRGNVLFLGLVFALLAFMTGKVVLHLVSPAPGLATVDLTQEWGIIPFFALPWIGWIAMLRLHRRHRRQHANYQGSINASVAALLDENRSERVRYKVIGALLIVSALLLPLIVFQLRAVGKAGNEILFPAFVLWPGYVVVVLLWASSHYRRKLLPRKSELEALLQQYRSG
ncbi:MAG TPA: hypothetical protein VHO24_08215 [Opitutaceae bacterium]|nr:hypothetical protein [Opitutaceae bacterium]